MATARKILKLQRPFPMRRGGELPNVEVAYETWGDPAVRHDNAIMIFTGLSPSAHAASSTEDSSQGWWEDMIGPGRPIDTRRFFVICINSLGSPFGSTSPISINPTTGEPYRLTFNNTGAPTSGKAGAPVTLVEFSDFQCPYCQGFVPTLKRIEKVYGDKVMIVYRQYPIPNLHPNAFKAAEASLCANEEGKFWELHDVMFAEQQQLSVSDLKEKARRLSMNSKKFDGCLDSGRYVEQVQNDQKEGLRVGISGTPAVFINGILVEGGAVPFETIASIINRELARADRAK